MENLRILSFKDSKFVSLKYTNFKLIIRIVFIIVNTFDGIHNVAKAHCSLTWS